MRPIKIELYRGQTENARDDLGVHIGYRDNRWRWTARRSGRIIAASSEAYTERIKAVDNIALVFGIPLRRLVNPGARTINVTYYRNSIGALGTQLIEVKTR